MELKEKILSIPKLYLKDQKRINSETGIYKKNKSVLKYSFILSTEVYTVIC